MKREERQEERTNLKIAKEKYRELYGDELIERYKLN